VNIFSILILWLYQFVQLLFFPENLRNVFTLWRKMSVRTNGKPLIFQSKPNWAKKYLKKQKYREEI